MASAKFAAAGGMGGVQSAAGGTIADIKSKADMAMKGAKVGKELGIKPKDMAKAAKFAGKFAK